MLITTPHTWMRVFISRKKNTPDSSSTRNSTTWIAVSKIRPPIIVGYPTCRWIFDGPAQLDGCITHVFTKTSEISTCYSTNCLDNLPASEWLVTNGLGVSLQLFDVSFEHYIPFPPCVPHRPVHYQTPVMPKWSTGWIQVLRILTWISIWRAAG
jgi:hypothetical protein